MEKAYVFKQYREGANKTSGKPYKILELHDPNTLENTTFYLKEHQNIEILKTLKLHDKVNATHGVEVFNGKAQITVENIRKLNV